MLRAWRYRKNYVSRRDLGLDIEYSMFKAAGVCLLLLLIPAFVSVTHHARSWQEKQKSQWHTQTATVVSRGPYQTENPDITFRVDTVKYRNSKGQFVTSDFKIPFTVAVGDSLRMAVSRTGQIWIQRDLDRSANNPLNPGTLGQVTSYALRWLLVYVVAFVATGFAWHFITISRRVRKERINLALA